MRGRIACAFAALLLPAVACAQDRLTESRRRLEAIRQERAELRAELQTLRGRVRNLVAELQNLEEQRTASERLLQELDWQIAELESTAQRAAHDLATARDRLVERRAVLHRRLREIYKRGPLFTVQVLLAAESFADLLNRYKYLYLIARRDRDLVTDIARLEATLALRERTIRQSLAQIQALRAERARELAEVQAIERERRATLAGMRARERQAARRVEELAAAERALEARLASLERRRQAAAAERGSPRSALVSARAPSATTTSRRAGTAFARGALAWPVDGAILYPFGRAAGPGGTVVRYNGLGLAAPPGTPVRAVADGTVVVAERIEGYGPSVVVDHGSGYYTVYLYLEQLRVRPGDAVRAGDTIGFVGSRADGRPPHLEFQVRGPGGQALDHMPWLAGRR